MISLGRRRIAAIGAQSTQPITAGGLRLTGFRDALIAAGLKIDEKLIIPATNFFRADGAAAMEQLLRVRKPPDAVFCFSDLLAVGALRVLHDHGIRVPEDIAVIGFDDIDEAVTATQG